MEALETKIFITPILIAFEEAAVDINIINKLDSYVLVLTPAFCEKKCARAGTCTTCHALMNYISDYV